MSPINEPLRVETLLSGLPRGTHVDGGIRLRVGAVTYEVIAVLPARDGGLLLVADTQRSNYINR